MTCCFPFKNNNLDVLPTQNQPPLESKKQESHPKEENSDSLSSSNKVKKKLNIQLLHNIIKNKDFEQVLKTPPLFWITFCNVSLLISKSSFLRKNKTKIDYNDFNLKILQVGDDTETNYFMKLETEEILYLKLVELIEKIRVIFLKSFQENSSLTVFGFEKDLETFLFFNKTTTVFTDQADIVSDKRTYSYLSEGVLPHMVRYLGGKPEVETKTLSIDNTSFDLDLLTIEWKKV
jgi:hypothetical protein